MDARNCAAIVGVGCRLPGGIDSLDQLGAALFAGRDLVTEVPSDRFDPGLWSADPGQSRPGLSYTKAGAFLEDIVGLDAEFFGISRREAAQIDPQQRLLLEMTVEAFDHAGIDPATMAGSNGGVWVGTSTRGYWELVSARPEAVDAHSMLGTITANAANRVSFMLDWRGPSWSIDTACSSALVAVHQAARAVVSGEVRAAVAAGIGLLLNPADYLGFAKASVLSPTGRCRAFSALADGFVRGEGGAAVLLKPLEDALAAGDRVLAVVAGSGTNTDGQSVNMLSQPSRVTQQALLQQVYAEAGVSPDELAYLECHGTGTPVGDPVECEAIGAALGTQRTVEQPLPIGSVKTNIGHLECASGIAGMLKAMVVLGTGRIPPSLHGHPLNPSIDFPGLGLLPTDQEIPVSRTTERVAVGVNSFGIGGANAHVVLAEHLEDHVDAASPAGRLLPVLVSARSPEALNEAAWAMAEYLEDGPDRFYDAAFTSVCRRRRHEHAAVVLAEDAESAAQSLYSVAAGTAPDAAARCESAVPSGAPIGFVFAGNGSQWTGMAAELMKPRTGSDSVFADAVREVDKFLSPLLGWSPAEALAEGRYDLDRTDVAQPLLFAVQVGVLASLQERGIAPSMVTGHSVGEIAAAYAAGILDLAAACQVVAVRSAAQELTAGTGLMAAAAVSPEEAAELIESCGADVEVSAINTARDVTLSGDREGLERIGEVLADRGTFFRMLPLDYAFHSAKMDPIREQILEKLDGLVTAEPVRPMFSTVTGTAVTDGRMLDEAYWWRNIREPVWMADAVEAMVAEGAGVLVEIGPHPVLRTYLRRIAQSQADRPVAVTATLRRDEEPDLDASAAAVLASGGEVDMTTWFAEAGRVVDLPAYPWQRERLWVGEPSWWGHGPGDGKLVHPLLGERLAVPDPQWEGTVEVSRVPWLSGHQVAGSIMMPGAAFAEMALSAGGEPDEGQTVQVTDLAVTSGLAMPAADEQVQVHMAAAVTGDVVTISSRRSQFGVPDQAWQQHARGRLRTIATSGPPPIDTAAIGARLDEAMTGDEFYAMSSRAGTVYGPDFRALTGVRYRCDDVGGTGELLGEYRMPDAPAAEMTLPVGRYAAHPVLLDVALHAGGPLLPAVRDGSMLFMPVEFGALTVWSPLPAEGIVHVVSRSEAGREAVWDVSLAAPDGTVALTMNNIRFRLIEGRSQPPLGVWEVASEAVTMEKEHGAGLPADAEGVSAGWTVLADSGAEQFARWLADGLGSTAPSVVSPGDPARWADVVKRAVADESEIALVLSEGDDDPVAAAAEAGLILRDVVLAWQDQMTGTPDARLRCWLITGPCGAMAHPDLEAAGAGGMAAASAWGTARTISNEVSGIAIRRIAVESGFSPALAERVGEVLTAGTGEDDELAVFADGVRVPRVRALPPSNGDAAGREVPVSRALQVSKIGLTPEFETTGIPVPEPGPGEVVVEVRAAALNYKDVMLATGLMPIEPAQADWRAGVNAGPLIGQECAGVIVATGPDVTGLHEGQAVLAIAAGSLASHVKANAAVTVPIPEGMAFDDAATLPLVYTTAHYSLNVLAGMSAGETLLLPGGAGGVGLAALSLARLAGVKIIGLASTPEKRQLLLDRGAEYALDSRSGRFADEVRELTGGRGVDIVLNSLTGPAATACLELLAADGRFVELGKRDLYGDADLRLRPFLNTLSYFAVDLAQLVERRPERAGRALGDIAELAAEGRIGPLPHTLYPATQLDDAFYELKRSAHIGKLVIDTTDIPAPAQRVAFDPDGAYLVTGGTAGFGAATARWLAENGAGQVIVTGRRLPAEKPDHENITVLAADVTDRAAMSQAVSHARSCAPRGLRGVFHCAAGYDDGPVSQLSRARYEGVLSPKVLGAQHLDELTTDCDLDYFVVYSSISALFGNRLQASYGAANLCLETLARRRRDRGKPGLAVAWGAIAGTGVVVRDSLAESMTRLGLEPMPPGEALDRLGRLLAERHPHSAVIARVDWERAGLMFPSSASARFSGLTTPSAGTQGGSEANLRDQLRAGDEAGARELATQTVTNLIAATVRTEPENLSQSLPLTRIGLDSILATELAVTMRRKLDIDIPTLEILASQGIDDLARRVLAAAGVSPGVADGDG